MDVIETEFPHSLSVHVLLDNAQHYKGTIHDDVVARARGYRAALIPGAFVYGHISRLAVDAWGFDWIERGAIATRFRRPVYNHDKLLIRGSAMKDDGLWWRSYVSVHNDREEEVANGWIAMPRSEQLPSPSDLSSLSCQELTSSVIPSELVIGTSFRSRDRILSADDVATSKSAFAETHPLYERLGIVHSGMLMRLAMSDVNSAWKLSTAVVLVDVEAQHFRAVYPGQRLRTVGWIADTYERKGKHYFVSTEYLFADDKIVAHYRRTQIYG